MIELNKLFTGLRYLRSFFASIFFSAVVAACGGTDAPVAHTVNDAVTPTSTDVRIETSLGDITVALDKERAPVSVENFLRYVDNGHYDGTIFHRVIAGFMIQGGGFTQAFEKKPTAAPIANEAANGLANDTYTIAMARTSEAHSATSQFFINVADNAFLNQDSQATSAWGYAVFGRVVSGHDVVDQIAASATGAGGSFQRDVPVEAIVIKSINRKF